MSHYHRLRFPKEPLPSEAIQPGSAHTRQPKAEPVTLESIGSTGIMSIYSVHTAPLHADLDGRAGMYGPVRATP